MKNILIIFVMLISSSPLYAKDVMKFAYAFSSPPICWEENKEMRGILIDIVNEAVRKRMGISVSHDGYPWKRAQYMVRKGEADALITNGPLREEWAEHGNEVAFMFEQKLYAKAGGSKLDQLKKVKNLEDLRPFELIDERGGGWSKKNLIDNNFKVQLAGDHETIYRMLARGRADANINSAHLARYIIKKLGLQEQIVELATMESVPFHLVVGKKSPYTKVIPEFDETIRQMKKDGSLQKISDKYR